MTSYVIQNFFKINYSIAVTPKFKFLIFLKTIKYFFFFFKLDLFVKFFNTNWDCNSSLFYFYFKYLFWFKTTRLIFKWNSTFISNYSNNLFQSTLFYLPYNFRLLLENKETGIKNINVNSILQYNLYFNSIKIINFRIGKTYYQYIHMFILFYNLETWFAWSEFFKFKKNFIIIWYNLQFYYNYNTYFFNIYNY